MDGCGSWCYIVVILLVYLSISAGDYVRSNEALIEAIRVRDEKLVATEHLAKKFLEVH
jgi:membrane protein required for beta-lactamase induction